MIGFTMEIPEPELDISECVSVVDDDVEDKASVWENNCNAFTRKECAGQVYYGGKNECGGGHLMWRTFEVSPSATSVEFTARVFTVESWDGESFTMKLIDGNGDVQDEVSQNA
jgi:hypothetical protein